MNFFLPIHMVPISGFLITEHCEHFHDFFFSLTHGKILDIKISSGKVFRSEAKQSVLSVWAI